MIPVDQNLFGDQGNCVSACVASLLHLPIAAIPYMNGTGPVMDSFLASRGLRVVDRDVLRPQDGPAIVFGDGPRGRPHAVVGDHSGLLHDPHPSRAGVLGQPHGFVLIR